MAGPATPTDQPAWDGRRPRVTVRTGLRRRRGTVADHPTHLIHRYRLPGNSTSHQVAPAAAWGAGSLLGGKAATTSYGLTAALPASRRSGPGLP